MSYRARLLRATGIVFVLLSVTGEVITLNYATSIIGTGLAALLVAFYCVRKTAA